MRVIRTEVYIPQSGVAPVSVVEDFPLEESEYHNPAMSVAWFRTKVGDREVMVSHEEVKNLVSEIDENERVARELHWMHGRGYSFESFLTAVVAGALHTGRFYTHRLHSADARNLIETPIVIELSPPTILPLGTLLAKAPGIAIGTFVGIQAASEMPAYIALLTVPGGIIAVSSAIGISRALERGLNKAIEKLLNRHAAKRSKKD